MAAGTGLAFKEIVKRNPLGINTGIDLSDKPEQQGFVVENREYFQQMLFPSEVVIAHIR